MKFFFGQVLRSVFPHVIYRKVLLNISDSRVRYFNQIIKDFSLNAAKCFQWTFLMVGPHRTLTNDLHFFTFLSGLLLSNAYKRNYVYMFCYKSILYIKHEFDNNNVCARCYVLILWNLRFDFFSKEFIVILINSFQKIYITAVSLLRTPKIFS